MSSKNLLLFLYFFSTVSLHSAGASLGNQCTKLYDKNLSSVETYDSRFENKIDRIKVLDKIQTAENFIDTYGPIY